MTKRKTDARKTNATVDFGYDPATANEPLLFRRADGRLEQLCEHGVGHTVAIDRVIYYKGGSYETATEREKAAWWVHGCDLDDDGEPCCKNMKLLHD